MPTYCRVCLAYASDDDGIFQREKWISLRVYISPKSGELISAPIEDWTQKPPTNMSTAEEQRVFNALLSHMLVCLVVAIIKPMSLTTTRMNIEYCTPKSIKHRK